MTNRKHNAGDERGTTPSIGADARPTVKSGGAAAAAGEPWRNPIAALRDMCVCDGQVMGGVTLTAALVHRYCEQALAHPPSPLPAPEPVALLREARRRCYLTDANADPEKLEFIARVDATISNTNGAGSGSPRLPDTAGVAPQAVHHSAPEPHGLAEQLQTRLQAAKQWNNVSRRAQEYYEVALEAIAALRRAAGQERGRPLPAEQTGGWRPTSEAPFNTPVLVRGWGEARKHYVFGFAQRMKNRSGGELWQDDGVTANGEELWFAPHEFMPLPAPPVVDDKTEKEGT